MQISLFWKSSRFRCSALTLISKGKYSQPLQFGGSSVQHLAIYKFESSSSVWTLLFQSNHLKSAATLYVTYHSFQHVTCYSKDVHCPYCYCECAGFLSQSGTSSLSLLFESLVSGYERCLCITLGSIHRLSTVDLPESFMFCSWSVFRTTWHTVWMV